jgi:hypothetical protein
MINFEEAQGNSNRLFRTDDINDSLKDLETLRQQHAVITEHIGKRLDNDCSDLVNEDLVFNECTQTMVMYKELYKGLPLTGKLPDMTCHTDR